MKNSTTRVAALLALVFVAGVAGGVALDRTWLSSDRDRSERRQDRDRDRDRDRGDRGGNRAVIERFSEEIGLSEAQEAQIDTILARYRDRMEGIWRDVRPRYHALVDSVRQQIEAELDSAQVSRYRDLLEKQRRRDGDRDDDDRGREGNGRGGGADRGP